MSRGSHVFGCGPCVPRPPSEQPYNVEPEPDNEAYCAPSRCKSSFTSRNSGYSGKTTRSKSFSIPVRTRSRSGVSARSPPNAGTPDAGPFACGKLSFSQANTLSLNLFIVPVASAAGQCGRGISDRVRRWRLCVRDQLIPLREGLGRRNANRRRDYDDMPSRQIRKRINFLAATDSEHRSTDQRTAASRCPLRRQCAACLRWRSCTPRARSRPSIAATRIGRRRAHPSLHRQTLLDLDDDPAGCRDLPTWVLKGHGFSRAGNLVLKGRGISRAVRLPLLLSSRVGFSPRGICFPCLAMTLAIRITRSAIL